MRAVSLLLTLGLVGLAGCVAGPAVTIAPSTTIRPTEVAGVRAAQVTPQSRRKCARSSTMRLIATSSDSSAQRFRNGNLQKRTIGQGRRAPLRRSAARRGSADLFSLACGGNRRTPTRNPSRRN